MSKKPYLQPLLTRHGVQRVLAAKAGAECALLLVFSGRTAAGDEIAIRRDGTNVVLSWPVSDTNWVLECADSLASTNWTAVTAASVTNNGTVSVTVPALASRQFFRLNKDLLADKDPGEKTKDFEKDPFADKDPGEKDPTTDKTIEGPG